MDWRATIALVITEIFDPDAAIVAIVRVIESKKQSAALIIPLSVDVENARACIVLNFTHRIRASSPRITPRNEDRSGGAVIGHEVGRTIHRMTIHLEFVRRGH